MPLIRWANKFDPLSVSEFFLDTPTDPSKQKEFKFNFTYCSVVHYTACLSIFQIAGGSGITPMLQVIDAILKNPDDNTQVGCKSKLSGFVESTNKSL